MSITKITDDLRDTTALDGTKVSGTIPVGSLFASGGKGADIASAATVVIGTDGSYFDITGTTGISTQFTVAAGRRFTLQFNGAVVITDNAAITLSGAANFTTAAGDILSFVATAANTVVQTGYSLVDGGSPVAAAGGTSSWDYIETVTASTSSTITLPASGNFDSSTYKTHWVHFNNVDLSAAGTLRLRLYNAQEDEYDPNGYYGYAEGRSAQTSQTYDNNNNTYFHIFGVNSHDGNNGCSGDIFLANLWSTNQRPAIYGHYQMGGDSATYPGGGTFAGSNTSSSSGGWTKLQLSTTRGTIDTGSFYLYGLKTS